MDFRRKRYAIQAGNVKERRAMRKKKIAGMIVLGIAIAAVPFFMRMWENRRTGQYIKQFEEDRDESEETGNRKKKDSPHLAEGAIGLVEIPDLNLEYPVFEGTGAEQLNEGIGHMENTAPLCAEGNCVLAGHNGSSRGVYFTFLSNIKAGAEIRITNKEGKVHIYTVEEMRVVNPYDDWVTEESETELLTLFTCADHGTRRFVCKCVPVDYGSERGNVESE